MILQGLILTVPAIVYAVEMRFEKSGSKFYWDIMREFSPENFAERVVILPNCPSVGVKKTNLPVRSNTERSRDNADCQLRLLFTVEEKLVKPRQII